MTFYFCYPWQRNKTKLPVSNVLQMDVDVGDWVSSLLSWIPRSASPEAVGQTLGDLSHSNLHNDASALCCPGSIQVCQHLLPPVRVNSLADMTCPAPVIELLVICLPWLSCCHISVNLVVACRFFIRCDKGIKEHFALSLGCLCYRMPYICS